MSLSVETKWGMAKWNTKYLFQLRVSEEWERLKLEYKNYIQYVRKGYIHNPIRDKIWWVRTKTLAYSKTSLIGCILYDAVSNYEW